MSRPSAMHEAGDDERPAGARVERRGPDGEGASRTGPHDDTVRLVEAARRGDREAFGALHARHARMVHAIVLAHAPARWADDLVQDVFATALQRLPSLRDAAAFGGWLAAIARNAARDGVRRETPRDELPPDTAGTGSGSASAPLEAARALAALRELPLAYRETLVMRLVEGMTGPEIATRTGLTPGSVRVNLHRGMKMLRERLGADASERERP